MTLRGRGQFGRANEVSTDAKTWQSAATIERLFEGKSAKKTRVESEPEVIENPIAPSRPPSRSMQPVWYYSIGEEQCGPVTLLELRGLIASHQLLPEDLVWKEGFEDWMALQDVAELNAVARTNGTAVHPLSAAGQSTGQHFCFACGTPTDSRAEVCPKCGVRQPQVSNSKKDRLTAALLAFFLGGIGVHHFYLGNMVLGVIYVLFCWTLIPGIIALVEGIMFLCMSDASFQQRFKNP